MAQEVRYNTSHHAGGTPEARIQHGTVQSPSGLAGASGQVTNVHAGGGGRSGWVDPRPLTNPPGTNWVDAQMIADEVRQRAELKRKLGG